MEALFAKYDYDKSGTLEANEVVAALKESQGGRTVSPYEVERFMEKIDENGDGKISKAELYNVFKQILK